MRVAGIRKTSRIPGSIIVISAPSGSGKSTLVRRLMDALPDLVFSVSYTTRPPRPGERNGREYFFISRRRFEQMIARGEFVEWADVYGQFYGTSRKQLLTAQQSGRDILLDIDVQGHRQVRDNLPEAVSVFILPPSFQELERRLWHRHSDAPEVIEKRLRTAQKEITYWSEYHYIVVNDRLPTASRALRAIVEAARFRRQTRADEALGILKTFGG